MVLDVFGYTPTGNQHDPPSTSFSRAKRLHPSGVRLRSARYAPLRSASPRRGEAGWKKDKLQKTNYTGPKSLNDSYFNKKWSRQWSRLLLFYFILVFGRQVALLFHCFIKSVGRSGKVCAVEHQFSVSLRKSQSYGIARNIQRGNQIRQKLCPGRGAVIGKTIATRQLPIQGRSPTCARYASHARRLGG